MPAPPPIGTRHINSPTGKSDLAGGLILALRGFVLVLAGAALWHWPVGSGIVRILLAVLALLIFLVAALAFLVASAAWRNATLQALGGLRPFRDGVAQNIILALPFLTALAAFSVLLFLMVGQLFAGT